MRAFAIAAGLFAVASVALPAVQVRTDEDPCEDETPCMTYDQALKVADNFKTLIADFSNATANAVLTTDFQDFSDSVSTLINAGCSGPQTLGAATFTTREAFEAGQGSQPNIPFQLLNLWHTCDTVIIRWRTALKPEFVTGLIVMETTYQADNADQPFLINTVFSEFNSGAWLVDTGAFTPSCNATGHPGPHA